MNLSAESVNLIDGNFSRWDQTPGWRYSASQNLKDKGFKASPSTLLKLYMPEVQGPSEYTFFKAIPLTQGKEYFVSIRVNVESEGKFDIYYIQDVAPYKMTWSKSFALSPGENRIRACFTPDKIEDGSSSIRFKLSNIRGTALVSDPLLTATEGNREFLEQRIGRETESISLDFRDGTGSPAMIQPATSAGSLPDESLWAAFNCLYEKNTWSGKTPDSWAQAYKKVEPANWKKLWIKKDFKLPEGWKDSIVELDMEVNTKAEIYLNGRKTGEINWPNDSLFLMPDQFKRGNAENSLTVFMDSSLPPDPVLGAILEGDRTTIGAPSIRDCLLIRKSHAMAVKDVFIRTSVRQKQLNVRLNTFLPSGSVKVIPEFVVYDNSDGASVFSKKCPEQDLKDGWNEFLLDWIAPKLWDVGMPNMYHLGLNLYAPDGKLLAAPPLERFGFREFEIIGKEIKLNGRNLRLAMGSFPICGNNRELFKGMLSCGYNMYFDPVSVPGVYNHKLYRRAGLIEYGQIPNTKACDETGVVLFASAPPVSALYEKPEALVPDGRIQQLLQRHFYRYVRKLYNSPSIIAWNVDYSRWYWGNPLISPEIFGKSEQPATLGGWKSSSCWEKITQSMRQIDPTRFFVGHNNDAGDIAAPFIYMNWMPEQEYMEFLSDWKKNPGKPIMGSECGTPAFGGDCLRRTIIKDPLVTEYAAMRIGDLAYEMESDAYTETIDKYAESFKHGNYSIGWDQFKKEIESLRDKRFPSGGYLLFPHETLSGTALLQITASSLDVYRYWRADGANGGITNWIPMGQMFFTKTDPKASQGKFNSFLTGGAKFHELLEMKPPIVESLKANCQPVMAYIAGSPEIYDRGHNYHSGGEIAKQIVLLCDNPSTTPVTCSWTVKLDNKLLLEKSVSLNLVSGSTEKVPFSFKLPKCAARQHGLIELSVTSNKKEIISNDSYSFTVFPDIPPVTAKGGVYIFAPGQDTADRLKKLNVTYESIEPGVVPAKPGTMIIGSKCLEKYGSLKNLKPWIQSGNRLIILEQDGKSLGKLGFRTIDARSRQVFIRDTSHPLLKGLDNEDFTLWQGHGTLLPKTGTELSAYMRSPHWGNRGTVSSVSIETPHGGPFKPLMQCEFDLNYSPLLEMRHGKGEILFCQLDVSSREGGKEPLADMILSTFAGLPLPNNSSRPTFYLGSQAGHDAVRQTGLAAKKIDSIASLPSNALIVVGEKTEFSDAQKKELKGKVDSGCNALILAQGNSVIPDCFDVSSEKENRYSALRNSPGFTDDVFNGLGPSEMHWRAKFPVKPLTGKTKTSIILPSGVIGKGMLGKGTVVQYQVSLEEVKSKGKVAEYTLWKQYRLVSQLGLNLGGEFEDQFLYWDADGWFKEEYDVLQTWFAVGPFDCKDAQDGLDRQYIKNESLPHCWGKVTAVDPECKLEWKQFDRTGSELFFAKIAGFPVDNGRKVAYFENFFESAQPGRGILHLEVDWYAKVWLNGKEIIRLDRTPTPVGPPDVVFLGKDEYEVPLEKKNRIVVKVVSGSMGLSLHRVMIKSKTDGDSEGLRSMYLATLREGDLPYLHYRW